MVKAIRLLALIAAWVWLSNANLSRVLAQGPINSSPGTSTYFDNRVHAISANSSLWYRFDYAGDKTLILTKMFNGTNTGLDYGIWSPDNSDKPFARGTARTLACGGDKCEDTDLTWKGATPVRGTYFLQVTNNSPKPLTFYLVLTGESVSFGPLPDTPPLESFSSPQNLSPDTAVSLQTNQFQAIPADTFLWYRFDYNGNGAPIALALADGRIPGVYFRLLTAEQAKQPDAGAFVGQGSGAVADCDTGKCLLGDIGWGGAMPSNGTYYVQVYNSNADPAIFRLLIEGEGIVLGLH